MVFDVGCFQPRLAVWGAASARISYPQRMTASSSIEPFGKTTPNGNLPPWPDFPELHQAICRQNAATDHVRHFTTLVALLKNCPSRNGSSRPVAAAGEILVNGLIEPKAGH
ncbi:hypothetical protein MesoLjLa_56360 [Mesorhizobium sp. L-2-11]|nr:hypothetical protein MesoLjLa_56360 [Mesorhizobium sp. L-2-11]